MKLKSVDTTLKVFGAGLLFLTGSFLLYSARVTGFQLGYLFSHLPHISWLRVDGWSDFSDYKYWVYVVTPFLVWLTIVWVVCMAGMHILTIRFNRPLPAARPAGADLRR